jgi:16S rRNA processing protein RimM
MEQSQENPLPEGQYYHDQIIGLQVKTTGGEYIGDIGDILTGKSNDNYIVKGATGEILIPAIEDVVQSIDLDKGYITIEPIEGLLDLNTKKPPK